MGPSKALDLGQGLGYVHLRDCTCRLFACGDLGVHIWSSLAQVYFILCCCLFLHLFNTDVLISGDTKEKRFRSLSSRISWAFQICNSVISTGEIRAPFLAFEFSLVSSCLCVFPLPYHS